MTRARLAFAAACLTLAAVIGGWALYASQKGATASASTSYGKAAIGGPFRLVDQEGRTVDQTILKGKWSAVFFGYTFCPDVCPTNLQTMAAVEDRLGADAHRLQVVFVSIDPDRDTPKQLRAYLASRGFPKGAVGLTGTPGEVAQAAKAYKVYYAKSGSGQNYLMDHSTATYLMDPQGEFVKVLPYGMSPDQVAGQIRSSMAGGA